MDDQKFWIFSWSLCPIYQNPTMSESSDVVTNASTRQPETVVTVEEYIKMLLLGLVEAVNTRSLAGSFTWKHISPNVKVSHEADDDASQAGRGRDAFTKGIDHGTQVNPGFHSQVLDLNVTVNKTGNVARAWMLRSCMGLESGRRMEVIGTFTYELQDDDWFLTEYKGIRSFSLFTSDDLVF